MDALGDYLIADMKDYIIVKFSGGLGDSVFKANCKYTTFVRFENGKKVLYMRLLKIICGCIQPTLLVYQKFKECLEEYSFKLNKYDLCVANNDMNVKRVHSLLVCG